MPDRICPFSVPLVQHDYACELADEIVRRGGAEIACTDAKAHAECCALHQRIKAAALEAMALEDDLLTLPHSILVKIQYGGLLGLQHAMQSGPGREALIPSITTLVTSALERFDGLGNIPYDMTTRSIADYRLQRRGRNKARQ